MFPLNSMRSFSFMHVVHRESWPPRCVSMSSPDTNIFILYSHDELQPSLSVSFRTAHQLDFSPALENSAMPQTVRKFWGPQTGRQKFNLNWSIIDQDSVVLVTAAQYVEAVPPSKEHRFIGSANITVENIAPHGPPFDNNHGVEFYLRINSPTPINVVTDITVLDNKPVEVQT
jgi:hypothetical protein